MRHDLYTLQMRKKIPGWIDKRLELFEKRCLIRLMRKTVGNVRQAAKLTDTRRSKLYLLMKKHGLKINDFRTTSRTS